MNGITQTVIAEFPPNDGREWDCQCARCGSSAMHVDCWNCDDGYSHHDCGEDSCCCLYPEDNVVCDVCRGRGCWYECISSHEWCEANPLEGREDVPCGSIEWFCVERQP